MLISGVAYFMLFWNHNFFDNYMVERLYRMKKEGVDGKKGKQRTGTWRDSTF